MHTQLQASASRLRASPTARSSMHYGHSLKLGIKTNPSCVLLPIPVYLVTTMRRVAGTCIEDEEADLSTYTG